MSFALRSVARLVPLRHTVAAPMASRFSRTLANDSSVASKKDSMRTEKQLAVEEVLKSEEEHQHDLALKREITVEGPLDLSPVVGVPEQHLKERYVRIFRPAKNAMQSGTAGIRRWRIEFENRERWENNLMGWASSGDPLSNMQVDFANKEEAIAFVEKHGWDYFVEEPKEKTPKPKSYALNFAWNKRARKSTK